MALIGLVTGFLLAIVASAASAGDLADSAKRLSDGAFALLNSLNAGGGAGSDDLLAAVAGFAGDAQALAGSLAGGDKRASSKAMAALIADRAAVAQALAKNPKALDSAAWNSLESQLNSLKAQVPPAADALTSAAPRAAPSPGVVPPPPEETAALGAPPRIVITRREFDDEGVRIKGYFEGDDLKSAGIYDGETLVTPVQVGTARGRERVNFDFRLENVTAQELVRVSDSLGRTAEALVAPQARAATPRSHSHEKMIELGAGPDAGGPSGPPAVVASKGKNTVEIPSKSPSRRHIHRRANLSPLAGVEINILGVVRSGSSANGYQVVGQIAGEGVKRAGIYVDGRLVKAIPVTPGQYTSFDVAFTMLGREATIRAYGNGDNYVESGIDLSSANSSVFTGNPPLLGLSPYGYGVNPYAYPYGYGGYGYGGYGYPLNPYGSMNPYAPSPYGYGPPLGGRGYPGGVPPTTPGWPWH